MTHDAKLLARRHTRHLPISMISGVSQTSSGSTVHNFSDPSHLNDFNLLGQHAATQTQLNQFHRQSGDYPMPLAPGLTSHQQPHQQPAHHHYRNNNVHNQQHPTHLRHPQSYPTSQAFEQGPVEHSDKSWNESTHPPHHRHHHTQRYPPMTTSATTNGYEYSLRHRLRKQSEPLPWYCGTNQLDRQRLKEICEQIGTPGILLDQPQQYPSLYQQQQQTLAISKLSADKLQTIDEQLNDPHSQQTLRNSLSTRPTGSLPLIETTTTPTTPSTSHAVDAHPLDHHHRHSHHRFHHYRAESQLLHSFTQDNQFRSPFSQHSLNQSHFSPYPPHPQSPYHHQSHHHRDKTLPHTNELEHGDGRLTNHFDSPSASDESGMRSRALSKGSIGKSSFTRRRKSKRYNHQQIPLRHSHGVHFASLKAGGYTLNALFADSSVPGLREICHSDHFARKIMWLFAFILLGFLALSDIQQLLSDFYSYPITVDVRLRESRKLPFPAVTVCNLNIVRYSALCNSTLNISMPIELQEKLCGIALSSSNQSIDDINDIISDSDSSTTESSGTSDVDNGLELSTTRPNASSTPKVPKGRHRKKPPYRLGGHHPGLIRNRRQSGSSSSHKISSSSGKTHPSSGSASGTVSGSSSSHRVTTGPTDMSPELEAFELTERQEKELQENLTTWLAVMVNKNKNLTVNLGHQFDDMILRCTIKNSNCTHPNAFVSSFTPTEGNCYTFIAKTNTNPPHTQQTHPPQPKLTTFIGSATESITTTMLPGTSPIRVSPISVQFPYTTNRPPDHHPLVQSHNSPVNVGSSSSSSIASATGTVSNDTSRTVVSYPTVVPLGGANSPPVTSEPTWQITQSSTAKGGYAWTSNPVVDSYDSVKPMLPKASPGPNQFYGNRAPASISDDFDQPLMQKQVESILAGPDHGLELVINLEVNEYLPGTSQVGALVLLHSPDDFGISAGEGIMVAPECATYIGLKMMRISRLPAPYPEQCIDVWPVGLQRKSMLNASYSQQACIKICLQRTIQTRCNCQSAFLEQVELNNTEFRICDTRKRNTRKCVEEVMLRPENKLDDCQCPPRCQVIQYEKTISVARWPTREKVLSSLTTRKDRVSFDRGTKDINITNVAKVVVYFQTMTLQEVTQQAAWTTAKLFSSLGGFMGMYVGFSFLSLFEVFEILIRRMWFCMSRRTPSFRAVAKGVLMTVRTNRQIHRNPFRNRLSIYRNQIRHSN